MGYINGHAVGTDLYQTQSITANSQSLTFDVKDAGNLTLFCSGTFNTVNVTFEGSLDNVNWFSVTAVRTNGAAIESTTGNLSASPAYAWELSVASVRFFRIRSTAWTSGTQVWIVSPSFPATEPNPYVTVVGTVPVSGTVTATPSGTTTVSGTVNNTPTGGSVYSLVTAATTNAATIKTSGAGTLYELTISNPTATAAYVKIYSKASAPTVGTDVPIMTIPVAASAAGVGLTAHTFGSMGKRILLGIAIAVTAAAPATDVAATVAGIQIHATYI